ncbi:aspartate aminotransferase family protein [Emergencia sp.]|uniref:aspartate aminotransferase family protein n=1 Tax=Emergencia sp. TaxID=1926557 RepID=UPI003AEF7F5A
MMKKRFTAAMEKVKLAYAQERPLSEKLHKEARRFLPGGDTRTATFFLPYPNFIERGSGAYLYDVDGHRLLDFQNNYTSLIHGHGHRQTAEAVQKQISLGSAYAAPFEAQTRLASLLTERFPGLELVRFTNSGTEANMHALRIARAYTGKAKIIKTEGGYHGTTDVFEASVDPNIKKAGTLDQMKVIPESRGVSANALKDVLVVPFNDIERTRAVIEGNYRETACLIIEPIMGSAGQITPMKEYLAFLRDITRNYHILLIFDEVVTGRLSLGGAQKFYGVTPDITTLGKIIGGGTPVGAFGGKREIMELYDPKQKKMYHSGTFNGNALTVAAGLAAMECYDQEAVDHVNRLGRLFAEEMREIYHRLGLNMKVSGEGSIYNILFTDREVRNYRDVAASHEELNKLLYMLLLTKGVFNAERGMFCMSTAMEERDVRFGLQQVEIALAEMLPVIEEVGPELII